MCCEGSRPLAPQYDINSALSSRHDAPSIRLERLVPICDNSIRAKLVHRRFIPSRLKKKLVNIISMPNIIAAAAGKLERTEIEGDNGPKFA